MRRVASETKRYEYNARFKKARKRQEKPCGFAAWLFLCIVRFFLVVILDFKMNQEA